jgi:hypothetical protein
MREIDQILNGAGHVVMYGHPCYEGMQSALLEAIFRTVLERGYTFVTHAEWADRLSSGTVH